MDSFFPDSKKKWYEYETKIEVLIPIAMDTARGRLKNAFASEIKKSKGFWSSTLNYSGNIDNDNLYGYFTISNSRYQTSYYTYGQLMPYKDGCCLKMSIRDNLPILWLIPVVYFVVHLSLDREIIGAVFVAIVFSGFFFGGHKLHHYYAVNEFTFLMRDIISGNLLGA